MNRRRTRKRRRRLKRRLTFGDFGSIHASPSGRTGMVRSKATREKSVVGKRRSTVGVCAKCHHSEHGKARCEVSVLRLSGSFVCGCSTAKNARTG